MHPGLIAEQISRVLKMPHNDISDLLQLRTFVRILEKLRRTVVMRCRLPAWYSGPQVAWGRGVGASTVSMAEGVRGRRQTERTMRHDARRCAAHGMLSVTRPSPL